jgi:hypothetical protein
LQDPSVVAKRLGRSVRYVVAAPEYLKGRALPIEPADLKQHACVMLNARNNETDWDLVSGRKSPALMSPDRYRVATSIPSAHSCTGKAAKDRATNLQYPLVAAQWSPHAFDRWR